MQFKDYYKLLGLQRDASPAEIKKAYRKQARKFHPDMNKASNATQSMADINEARDVLSDPQKREAYDTLGIQRDAPPRQAAADQGGPSFHRPADWSEHFHFAGDPNASHDAGVHSDFFDLLFGSGLRSKPAKSAPMRGNDLHASITLDLLDAYQGADKWLTVRAMNGLEGADNAATEVQISIPKGIFEGQQIRLAGRGSAGSGGGAQGDLLLDVRFKPDARWRTQGRDVYGPLPLAPWEAALSPWLMVQTPTGPLEVKIPSGWTKGRTLRLKGRGIPESAASTHAQNVRGDLYLELGVVWPAAQSSQARDAYAALALAFPDFQPRAV